MVSTAVDFEMMTECFPVWPGRATNYRRDERRRPSCENQSMVIPEMTQIPTVAGLTTSIGITNDHFRIAALRLIDRWAAV